MRKTPKFPSTYVIRRIKNAIDQFDEDIGAITIEPMKITLHFAETRILVKDDDDIDELFRKHFGG